MVCFLRRQVKTDTLLQLSIILYALVEVDKLQVAMRT